MVIVHSTTNIAANHLYVFTSHHRAYLHLCVVVRFLRINAQQYESSRLQAKYIFLSRGNNLVSDEKESHMWRDRGYTTSYTISSKNEE